MIELQDLKDLQNAINKTSAKIKKEIKILSKKSEIPKAVRLKDGTYAAVIEEWNWSKHPFLKIMDEDGHRIYGDFVDVELNGTLKTHSFSFGPLPVESKFHRVMTTVERKDVEFVNLK